MSACGSNAAGTMGSPFQPLYGIDRATAGLGQPSWAAARSAPAALRGPGPLRPLSQFARLLQFVQADRAHHRSRTFSCKLSAGPGDAPWVAARADDTDAPPST